MIHVPRAFIFDLDGVLVDSTGALCRSFLETLGEAGLPKKTPEEIMRFMGMETHDWLRRLVPVQIRDDGTIEELCRKVEEKYEGNYVRQNELYPDAAAALEALKCGGHKLAVATNNYRKTALELLGRLGIMRFFDAVATLSDVERPKPEPDTILYALGLLDVGAKDAAFVGDSATDLAAGKRAGVRTVLMERPWNDKLDHGFRIGSLSELSGGMFER